MKLYKLFFILCCCSIFTHCKEKLLARAEILFFGNDAQSSHTEDYASILAIKLFKSGINLTYTTNKNDLNKDNLDKYDGLVIFGNPSSMPEPEKSNIDDFIKHGKGIIAINSGSDAQDSKQNVGDGRIFSTPLGANETVWTDINFLNRLKDGVIWALGEKVNKRIAELKLPDADIYNSDTISDYRKPHRVPKMQNALSPEESIKLIQVPVDFEIKLFAAEPDITNPIAMAWDEKGRLWIVESVDYPSTFVETDGAANDRIKICEDTDNDGKADKFTVFADSLNIPTGIAFANGGIMVAMAPSFIFLKDTNGDDRADIRRTLFSGWGKGDTHAGPSNLQYGFDNKIWGAVGMAGFNGFVDGKEMRFACGIYSLDPDGKNMEFKGRAYTNMWGLGFTEDNNVFISTANNTHSAYYSCPEYLTQPKFGDVSSNVSTYGIQKIDGHYNAHVLTPNLRQVDVIGGFTSATGHSFYTARSFPKEYWNRIAFVNEPTARIIHKAIIEPEGAGFKEKDGWNLTASSDEWYAPVYSEVGPDGAVWIADWYNFVIQHAGFGGSDSNDIGRVLPYTGPQKEGNGGAFLSPMRDINHGRVYRVVYKNAPEYSPLKLSKKDPDGLIAALKNNNMFWRKTAQRLLVENRDRSIASKLYSIINNKKVDEIGLNNSAVHALWTLQGLGILDGSDKKAFDVVVGALSHPAAGVRKAAVEVLPKKQESLNIISKSGIVNDTNLNTRLAVLRSLADFPASQELANVLFKACQDSQNVNDKWISKVLIGAALMHEKEFLEAVKKASGVGSSLSFLIKEVIQNVKHSIHPLSVFGTFFPRNPDVTGKEIFLKMSMFSMEDKKQFQQFVFGQGNKQDGYALFIDRGNVFFNVYQQGKQYGTSIKLSDSLAIKLDARLTKGGHMTLKLNDLIVSKSKAPSLFTNSFNAPMRAVEDLDGNNRLVSFDSPEKKRETTHISGFAELVNAELPASEKNIVANQDENKINESNTSVVTINVVKDIMQYDKKVFYTGVGQKLIIRFHNPDGMQHNLVIIKPGTIDKLGAAADAMARDPKGAEKNYVPSIPEVLCATKLVNPGETVDLAFTVPSEPGDYPFVCTFPGHWRIMSGIMTVTK